MADLDAYISTIPVLADIPWPEVKPTTKEADFNKAATLNLSPALLMDAKNITARSQTTSIELCDILTADKRLIHVKRDFGSSDLSHLFSQGFVSARLLQEDLVFREAAGIKVAELAAGDTFAFIGASDLQTSEFEVIFAIVAKWQGRSPSKALPFFSKVNLDRTVRELLIRGYRVSLSPVDTA
jgi:uncharacterized protein (TIGR04141 family)